MLFIALNAPLNLLAIERSFTRIRGTLKKLRSKKLAWGQESCGWHTPYTPYTLVPPRTPYTSYTPCTPYTPHTLAYPCTPYTHCTTYTYCMLYIPCTPYTRVHAHVLTYTLPYSLYPRTGGIKQPFETEIIAMRGRFCIKFHVRRHFLQQWVMFNCQ